jgi:hypothetical protein
MTHEQEQHLLNLQRIVVSGGGCFIGVQETLPPDSPLVLFNSEATNSTYALADDEFFTINAVQDRIKIGDAAFNRQRVAVPRFILKELHECITKAEAHLSEYLNTKK